MSYIPLKSIYYSQKNSYEEEYNSRFNSPSTLKFNIEINENPAFVVITPELFNKMYEITTLNNTLENVAAQLPPIALEQYAKKCLIDEIVLTNEIEGVISTRKDVFEIMQSKKIKDKNNRLAGLVTKYLMLSKSEKISIKTCQDIRNIYDDLVLSEITADNPENIPDGIYFRKKGVNVVSQFGKVIHTGIEPESKLNSTMTEALEILNNNDINILIRIAVFHYLFGYIHPFYDGNGRVSRFISSYLLSENLNFLTGYRLAYTVKENINAYYGSFKAANDKKNKGDLTPFTGDFFDILIRLLTKLTDSLNKRIERLNFYNNIALNLFKDNEKYCQTAFVIFQQTLFGTGGISVDELTAAADSSEYSVRNCLRELSEKQLLIVTQLGKKKLYEFDLDKFE